MCHVAGSRNASGSVKNRTAARVQCWAHRGNVPVFFVDRSVGKKCFRHAAVPCLSRFDHFRINSEGTGDGHCFNLTLLTKPAPKWRIFLSPQPIILAPVLSAATSTSAAMEPPIIHSLEPSSLLTLSSCAFGVKSEKVGFLFGFRILLTTY